MKYRYGVVNYCCFFPLRISGEHSPKLQIRSHSYLRAVSEVSINRSLDSLDPAALLTSPKFRSRNESYMRAMSTISQVSDMPVQLKKNKVRTKTPLINKNIKSI